jgi:Leucine-rich repeat (LRR) protein
MFKLSNNIVTFKASNNALTSIDPKFVKKIRKAQVIDFTANSCIDAIHDKNSTDAVSIDILHTKVDLECWIDTEE